MRDERGIYERLCLEGFQSGLSWLTILRKRPAFRAAFAGFDPERSRGFGDADVERLLADAGIVRHRGKIEAAIANARATVALRESGTPLARARLGSPPRRASAPRTARECRPRRPSPPRSRGACAGPGSASSGRRRSTPRCRHAASSTTTSPAAPSAPRSSGARRPLMLDERVRAVLRGARGRGRRRRTAGAPRPERSLQIAPSSGALLYALVRRPARLRGARDRRLARLLDDLARRRRARTEGRSSRSRRTPQARGVGAERSRRPGSRGGSRSSPATRSRRCQRSTAVTTSSSSTRGRRTTRRCSRSRARLVAGRVVVADNVCSHAAYWSLTRLRARPIRRLVSVTVPLDNGLEVTTVLTGRVTIGINRGKEVVR